MPGFDLLTFWNRKLTGGSVAAQNSCLATINELALAAREPGKQVHHCVLMGHSFGGLVLSNTISHSILDASSTGARNASPWDMLFIWLSGSVTPIWVQLLDVGE